MSEAAAKHDMSDSSPNMPSIPFVVTTLLCHKHVSMALDCLGSWQRLCNTPLKFRIHDDGTLQDHDVASLREVLDSPEIVSKQEAEELIATKLARYRNVVRLRENYKNICKPFDLVHYANDEWYCFIDSDILFWKKFTNPFNLLSKEIPAIFMRDRENSYSMRSWQKLLSRDVSLCSKLNSGFIGIKRELVCPELLDWFVGKDLHRGIPAARSGGPGAMLDQTFWAFLGARVGCRILDDSQFRVMRDEPDNPELIGGHFTAKTRHLLPKYVERAKSSDPAESPVQLRLVDPGRCTALDLFGYEIRRVAKKIGRR